MSRAASARTRRRTPAGPLLIAHRGDSAHHPENTSAAFHAALAAGADGIELDLRPTGDGAVVVCHDASLARFLAGSRALSRQTLRELAERDIGSWFHRRFSSERLLTLDQLLEAYDRTILLLELKASAGLHADAINARLVRGVIEGIRRHRAHQRVLILCFNATLLAAVASADPRLRLVRNCSRPPRHLTTWLARQPSLHGIDCDVRQLTPPFVERCHDQGLAVFTWSCNRAAELAHALHCGVDGILSDRPGWLVEQLRPGRSRVTPRRDG